MSLMKVVIVTGQDMTSGSTVTIDGAGISASMLKITGN